MQLVLGIDIGTTHCKAVALSADGRVWHEDKADYSTPGPALADGEQDATLIFNRVMELLQSTFSAMAGNQVTATCFSSAMHSIMAVDALGKPLTNAFTWAHTKSNEQAMRLRELPIAQELYNKTGTPIHPMSPLCKLAWLKHAMPEIFNAAHKFISIKEYIFFKLFGRYIVDHSIASATGLFDIYSRQWHAGALALAGVDASRLSEPVPVTHAETNLQKEYRELLAMNEDIPFIIGASDGCLANLGSGAFQKGEAALTIGTSGAVRLVVETPVPDAQQRLFNYILADGLYVTGGAVSNGGAALQWLANNFLQQSPATPNDMDRLLQLAHQSPPGADGLIFLPYLSGERAPSWDAMARGAFIGLQMMHGQAHMVRAVLEGISFALYQVLLAVEETNGDIKMVHASGAFVRSDLWVQLLCDVINKKIIVSDTADASAIGAALMGLHATGIIKNRNDVKQSASHKRSFEPDPAKHAIYQRYFEVYVNLYPKLSADFHRLGALQKE